MTCITVNLEKSLKRRMERFGWINWSEIGREEVTRREIFDRYVKTRKLSQKDERFCEKTDWHPVDELPVKEEYERELKAAQEGPHRKMNPEELDALMG